MVDFFFHLCKGMWLAGMGYTEIHLGNFTARVMGIFSIEKCGVKQFAREIAVLAVKCL